MNVLRRLCGKITGYRYYGVLIYDGHRNYISSNIFASRHEAANYSSILRKECISLYPAGIVSFRTKHKITHNRE